MAKEIDYKKEYLPGYTGHVPKKMEVFGQTAGETNRIIINQSGKIANDTNGLLMTSGKTVSHAQRTLYSSVPPQDEQNFQIQFTNKSKRGENWIGGPNQNIKAQHIPGYQGFVPSIKSENIYGKSFAKGTANAVNQEFDRGNNFNVTNQTRYMSQNADQHSKLNFRRIRDSHEPADINDLQHTQKFNDIEFQGLEIAKPNIYQSIPTVGYQGFKSNYKPHTVRINHRKDPFFNLNALRPRINQLNMDDATSAEIERVSDGFHKSIADHKVSLALAGTGVIANQGYSSTAVSSPERIKIPIAGYTGHRMGYRAQNFYGKTYKDCSIQSKVLQNMQAQPQ